MLATLLCMALACTAVAEPRAYNLDGPIGGTVLRLSEDYEPWQLRAGSNDHEKDSVSNFRLSWNAGSHLGAFVGLGYWTRDIDTDAKDLRGWIESRRAGDYYTYLFGMTLRPYGARLEQGLVERRWKPICHLAYGGVVSKHDAVNSSNTLFLTLSSLWPLGLVPRLAFSTTWVYDDPSSCYGPYTEANLGRYYGGLGIDWRLGDVFGFKGAPANQYASGWLPTLSLSFGDRPESSPCGFDFGTKLDLAYAVSNDVGIVLGVGSNPVIELQISNEKVTKAIQRLGCSSTEAFATAAAFEAADAIAA
jgi:hypothetical protein